jgi:hypothetical protein
LNLLFANTYDNLALPKKALISVKEPFYGIMPGMSAYPLWRIDLQVTLQEGENLRSKILTFKVADFESAYNCILGWRAPDASLGGKKEKEEMGFVRQGGVRAAVPTQNKKRGGSDTRARTEIESRQGCQKKRGILCEGTRQVRRHATATRAWHMWAPPPTASAGHAATATRQV